MTLAAALAAVVAVGVLAATAAPSAAPATTGCARSLADLRTLSDPLRTAVNLQPVSTTVAALNAKAGPQTIPTRRTPGFERHVWRLVAEITEYRLVAGGTIQLVLFDNGGYMTAEMPSAACLPKTARARRAILDARKYFEQRCGAATSQRRTLGAVAEIEGVGLWDVPRGQNRSRSAPVLSPVTRIRLIAGCA
jgi:hypothetical protein